MGNDHYNLTWSIGPYWTVSTPIPITPLSIKVLQDDVESRTNEITRKIQQVKSLREEIVSLKTKNAEVQADIKVLEKSKKKKSRSQKK